MDPSTGFFTAKGEKSREGYVLEFSCVLRVFRGCSVLDTGDNTP